MLFHKCNALLVSSFSGASDLLNRSMSMTGFYLAGPLAPLKEALKRRVRFGFRSPRNTFTIICKILLNMILFENQKNELSLKGVQRGFLAPVNQPCSSCCKSCTHRHPFGDLVSTSVGGGLVRVCSFLWFSVQPHPGCFFWGGKSCH